MRHRICSWCLERNLSTNVHGSQFNKGFNVPLKSKYSTAEFDIYWEQLVKECNLEGNEYISKLHRSMER